MSKIIGRRKYLPAEVRTLAESGKAERIISGHPKIGKAWIGPWCHIDSVHGTVTIGDGTTLADSVHIFTHTNEHLVVRGLPTKVPGVVGDVTIGKRVYIGSMVVIEPGVRIGDGAVVGAFSFVRRGTAIGPRERWWGIPGTNDAWNSGNMRR